MLIEAAPPSPGPADPTEGEVPPAAPTHRRGRFWALLLLPLVVGGLVRVLGGMTDDVPTTDATAYLRTGESVWNGDGYRREGAPELHFPPVMPVVLGGAERVSGDPLTGLVVVTVLSGTLLLVPLAAVGRLLGGDRAGLAAAWVGALCPALTTVPTNQGGGSEGPYLLLVLSALWVTLASARRAGPARLVGAVAAGGLTGVAYLTRPEGIAYSAIFVPVLVVSALGGWALVRRRQIARHGLRRAMGLVAAFGLAAAVFVVPYVDYLHTNTGRWELTAKSRDASLEAWRAVAEHDRRARDQIFYELDDDGTGFVAGRSTLGELVKSDPGGYLGIVGVNVRTAFSEMVVPRMVPFPVWELVPVPLLLLAGWAAWRSRRRQGVAAVLSTGAVALLVPLTFFVQPRYLTPAAAVVAIFAGIGLVSIPRRWWGGAWGVAAVLLVLSLAGGLGAPHRFLAPREQVEHRRMGEWLAANTPPDTRVMTRSLVVDYYADRVMVPMPYASQREIVAFARHHGVDYVVVDEYQLRRQRPQLARLWGPPPWTGLTLRTSMLQDGRLTRLFALDPPSDARRDELPSDVGFVGDEGQG